MPRPYPIVEFAQKIGKSTAELTTKDLCAFMKWWMKQQPRKDLMKMANYKQDLAAMNKWRAGKEEAEEAIEVEIIPSEEEEVVEGEETVCSMELTKTDVEALLWAINEIFENYDLTGTAHDLALKGLQEGLEGVE